MRIHVNKVSHYNMELKIKMTAYFNLNKNETSKQLLVNQFNMILDNQRRRVQNDQNNSSPHNELRILPVFAQKQPPQVF